jgi:hypothetical protein
MKDLQMKLARFAVIPFVLFILCGCKTVSVESKESLEKPINCVTAKEDIMTLENEKNSVAEQVRASGAMVFPAAAVVGILSGDYSDRAKVAAGEFNQDIDKKIQEIKSCCGIE